MFGKRIATSAVFIGSLGLVQGGDFIENPVPEPLPVESEWEFGFRPYLWMTGLSGDIGFNGITAPVDIEFDDIFDNLDFAWSSTLEAKKGKWGALLDFTYLDLSKGITPSFSAPPGPSIAPSGVEVEMFLVDLMGSYRTTEWDGGFFDLTAGVRWMSVENSVTLTNRRGRNRSLNAGDDWFDPHIGFRARHNLNPEWFVKGFADVGGFGVGSDMTYQALMAFGYQFNDTFALELGYRYLREDYKNGNTFTFDTEMHGPIIGLTFNW